MAPILILECQSGLVTQHLLPFRQDLGVGIWRKIRQFQTGNKPDVVNSGRYGSYGPSFVRVQACAVDQRIESG